MQRIIRWLRGYVVFTILGRFPERFINLCMRQGRFLFSIKPGKDKFSASMLISDYREIRPVARASAVRLRIREKHGLPIMLRRYRSRLGLLVGMLVFIIIAQVMQCFVWTVDIHGLETLSESSVAKTLIDEGLYEGVFKGSVDIHSVERRMMEEIDGIGWMSINIIGTKAEVEIKEKDQKPVIPDFSVPCNIKAIKDGLILRINTRKGKAVIGSGSAVIEGQLLVSAAVENSLDEVEFVRADAEVIAQTLSEESFNAVMSGEYKMPLKKVTRHKLIFLWLKIPVTFSAVSGESSSRIETRKIFFNDNFIELGIVTEHCVPYSLTCYELTPRMAERRLYTEDLMHRLFEMSSCLEISAERSLTASGDEMCLDVSYTCEENIASAEIFVVN